MEKRLDFKSYFIRNIYRLQGVSLLVFLLYSVLFIVYSIDLTLLESIHLIIAAGVSFYLGWLIVHRSFYSLSYKIYKFFRYDKDCLGAYQETLEFPPKFSITFSLATFGSILLIIVYMLVIPRVTYYQAFIIFMAGILFLIPAGVSSFFITSFYLIRVKTFLFKKSGINSIHEEKILRHISLYFKLIFFSIIISFYTFTGISAFFLNSLKTARVEQVIFNDTLEKLFIIISVNLILSIGFSILLSRNIILPLKVLRENFEKMVREKGNLSQRAEIISYDETGYTAGAFNSFLSAIQNLVNRLKEISANISDVSDVLYVSSAEITGSSEAVTAIVNSVAEGISGQLDQVRNIVRQAEQISSEALGVLSATEKSGTVIKKVVQSSSTGQDVAEKSVTNINILVSKSKTTIAGMKKLTEKISQIGEIAETINTLAVQTNLLALNAAIESNRAGTHGVGFSVIAKEIRNLNEDTSSAAQKISNIIIEIQSSTQEVIEQIEAVSTQVDSSRESIDNTGNNLKLISKKVRDTDSKIRRINQRANSQRVSMQKTSQFIEEMAAISEDNAGTAQRVSFHSQELTQGIEDITRTSQLISEYAQRLNELILICFRTEE